MQEQQLELNLDLAMEQAIAQPALANLSHLWIAVEQRLRLLADDEQLRLAGAAIAQLTEIYALRAEYFLKTWEEKWDEQPATEPVLTDEMLSAFLRQTMSLNLEEVLECYEQHRHRSPEDDSLAGEVEKEALLEWLAHEERQKEKERAIAVAHDESVTEWIHTIRLWLIAHGRQAPFRQLVNDLQQAPTPLSPITVWLGVLLGGFRLQTGPEFYSHDFWVSLPDE
ncbi:MAG TPA: hypothetical protein IGS37_14690 [Synechococcales cyanobacterium M55_K2018_004]|nr:hypothetical protein [Synechococcales cyanobacterium M55_K2018_004]